MILDDILKVLKNNGTKKAYTVNNISYSYEKLYMFVCNIYNFLLKENKDKKPIVVYGNKEIYMKAAFLASSFAGITYVPIDESIPKERVDLIITFSVILVYLICPVVSHSLGTTHRACRFCNTFIHGSCTLTVVNVVYRTVSAYADFSSSFNRVDVCTDKDELPAVSFLLSFDHFLDLFT